MSTSSILNSSLRLSKAQIEIATQNVANADNAKYSAKSIETSAAVVAGFSQGVRLDGIKSSFDNLMYSELLNRTASTAHFSHISDKCKEIADKIANPHHSIFKTMREFERSISALSLNPNDISMRNDARDKASNLAVYISDLSKYLQSERQNADKQLSDSISIVNSILVNLQRINTKQMCCDKGSMEYLYLEDEMSSELSKLSEYFDVTHSKDSSGVLHVYLKNNGQEIIGKQRYHLEYNNSQPDTFEPIYIVTSTADGRILGKNILVNGGESGFVNANLNSGHISALLKLRDEVIPSVSETVDQIALKTAEAFNEVHNKGNGATPVKALNGTALVSASDHLIGNGTIIINAMDDSGKPLFSGDYGKIPGMKLDLSSFSTSDLRGAFNLQGIVDEINRFFESASTGSRLDINGFHNIQLASRSKALDSIELDFDLTAYTPDPSVSDVEFSIGGVTARDAAGNNISLLIGNNNPISIKNGDHLRGGPVISLQNKSTDYPITVTVDVTTTVNGISTVATVDYIIPTPTASDINGLNGFLNKRFDPAALVTADPGVKIKQGGLAQAAVKASIVDDHGNPIADPKQKGHLKIENTLRRGTVAVDQGQSQIMSPTNGAITGSFSKSLGLNDLFVFKDGSDPVASRMVLNEVIEKSPSALSLGKMQAYRVGEKQKSPAFFFAAGVGDSSLIEEYNHIKNKQISFSQTRDIVAKSTNLHDYVLDVISVNNIRASNASAAAERENTVKEMLEGDLSAIRGVNTDDEIMRIMQYQRSYMVATKLSKTVNDLLDALINSI